MGSLSDRFERSKIKPVHRETTSEGDIYIAEGWDEIEHAHRLVWVIENKFGKWARDLWSGNANKKWRIRAAVDDARAFMRSIGG